MKKTLTCIIALALVVSFSFAAVPQKTEAFEDFIVLTPTSKPIQERTFVLSNDFDFLTLSPVAGYLILVVDSTTTGSTVAVEYDVERVDDMTVGEFLTIKPNAKTYLNLMGFGIDSAAGFESDNYKAEWPVDWAEINMAYPGGSVFALYYVGAYLSDSNSDIERRRVKSRIYFDLF